MTDAEKLRKLADAFGDEDDALNPWNDPQEAAADLRRIADRLTAFELLGHTHFKRLDFRGSTENWQASFYHVADSEIEYATENSPEAAILLAAKNAGLLK